MVQCEMCGANTGSPKTVKIEGAELDVCDDCADFGTEVETQESSTTSTKYSTSASSDTTSSSSSSSRSTSAGSSSSNTDSQSRRDLFDEMEEVAQDYDDRIRAAREREDLTQNELADQLNEKASLIQKLERGDVLPSDQVQRKLERALDISLAAGGTDEDTEWQSGTSPDGTTLGDVVQRKD